MITRRLFNVLAVCFAFRVKKNEPLSQQPHTRKRLEKEFIRSQDTTPCGFRPFKLVKMVPECIPELHFSEGMQKIGYGTVRIKDGDVTIHRFVEGDYVIIPMMPMSPRKKQIQIMAELLDTFTKEEPDKTRFECIHVINHDHTKEGFIILS